MKANHEARFVPVAMAEEDSPPRVDPYRVARLVSSYVRHHEIAADQLVGLIVEVHRALASLGRATPEQEPPRPAVPIRRSIQEDYVVCLECGYRARMLRRHLRVAHGLQIADYRARWRLQADHPLTAPSYSARRSTLAKEIGLGRRRPAAPNPPATERVPAASRPVSRRRGRRARRQHNTHSFALTAREPMRQLIFAHASFAS